MQHTNPPRLDGALIVIDALIDGLRIDDQKLNGKCLAALRSVGGRVVPHLRAAAYDRATRASHRRRLLNAAEMIEGFPASDTQAGKHIVDFLLDALRVQNAKLNDKAVAAFGCLPGEVVDHLITEAVCVYKKTGYCARLLTAADKVDGKLDVSRQMDLFFLTSRADKSVQPLAVRLLWKFGPFGPNQ
jgi:hypothetical protein